MSVYQVAGDPIQIDNGSSQILYQENTTNAITGASGVVQVKFQNSSLTTIEVVGWTNTNTTYTFTNVPVSFTDNPGTGATFDVVVTSDGYVITINNGGINYEPQGEYPPVLVLSGANLGGTDGQNDAILQVIANSGDPDYSITEFIITYQGPNWPQTFDGTTTISPNTTEFIQVGSGISPGSVNFKDLVGLADGTLYISAVNVISS